MPYTHGDHSSYHVSVVVDHLVCHRAELPKKGLFGLLVRSTSDAFYHELRHIHPNECLALQGFDPVIDFGNQTRLTLAAVGQMASPFQSLWIFSCLADRLAQLRSADRRFGPHAQMQAYQTWVLMRCRQVWPIEHETLPDTMSSLVNSGLMFLNCH